MDNFINITNDNIAKEHVCCIIRKGEHPGISTKKEWLKERIKEGHVFRKLDVKGVVFIEYAPLEKAWVPIEGDNFLYIYCLWVDGEFRGKGYAKSLMEYCISDAKAKGKSGICMLGAKKQKSWLSSQDFVKKYGFKVVDTTRDDYELLSLSFNGTNPRFSKSVKESAVNDDKLVIYYSDQCPFIAQRIASIKDYCLENKIKSEFIHVDSLEKAKRLPCPFNNWGVFYHGKFVTVNLLDASSIQKIISKK